MPETWPATLTPSESRWGIETNSLALESPWTRGAQIYEMQGARWVLEMIFRNLAEADQRELAGFLDHLRGGVGEVNVPPFIHSTLAGGATGSLKADGLKHAKTVDLSSIGGTNPALKRGDLFRVGGSLYRVTQDADATAGDATVSIAPPLRKSLADSNVYMTDLYCPMRLVGDDSAIGRFRPKPFGEWTLSFVEVLP